MKIKERMTSRFNKYISGTGQYLLCFWKTSKNIFIFCSKWNLC